ncbi:hypothetical protein MB9_0758 [Methanobacterium formicicum]|uniref:Apea-like HEPN domain-containing protein n=1 Tax=Methanobacterium formicicum TaxID=2162 RepID=A0A0S4FMZ8_METFO|nr:hypothetical protein MB9_0758 [Methanobacterium formicicum]
MGRKLIDKNDFVMNHGFQCPDCKTLISYNDELFINFFKSNLVNCVYCQKQLNIWKIFKDFVNHSVFGEHYTLLGCRYRFKEININPLEKFTLDLTEEVGDGYLLFINYNSYFGGVFPAEFIKIIPPSSILPKRIELYGCIPDKDKPVTETRVRIFYCYAPSQVIDDLSMRLILDAFQKYYENNYRHMVISASTAVEIAQHNFFSKILKTDRVSDDKIKTFLKDNATFSSQLKVLLPTLADKMKFPMLNEQIKNDLINLRKDRDYLVHKGELKKDWDVDKIKNELISSLFAIKYYKLVLDGV